jgi:tripartite-type tricarboxylate transporter receptor subunit TctC
VIDLGAKVGKGVASTFVPAFDGEVAMSKVHPVAMIALSALLMLAPIPDHVQAANYPDKTVTIISDAPAGSTPDVDTRFLAAAFTKMWGQQVIVVNHPGANGSIAARYAAQAAPDGYTLYNPVLSSFIALASVAPNLPVRLPRDFSAIGYAAENPMFIAVNPSLGISTLPQLIAAAKKRPGKISVAATGVARLTGLSALLLEKRAGLKFLVVPYNTRGPAAALDDIASGRVSFIIEGYSGIAGAVQAHRVKLIAVASAKRLPTFADLPTVAETLPGFNAVGWQVLLAPRGTPQPIINKVSADLTKVVSNPAFKAKLGKLGSYTRPMMPAQVITFVKNEQNTWLPLRESLAKK